MTDEMALARVAALGEALRDRGVLLATAESCTGGGLACVLTEVAGSSGWFERGFVTYSNAAKQDMLAVPASLFAEHGAVSDACVRAMAAGAIARSRATLAVSISGIAGPGGATPTKPLGTVWMGICWRAEAPRARHFHFDGDRQAVRRQAVAAALSLIEAELGLDG